jgi:hypothetical protein
LSQGSRIYRTARNAYTSRAVTAFFDKLGRRILGGEGLVVKEIQVKAAE